MRTLSFFSTRCWHSSIASSIWDFNGRIVKIGSNNPVGRMICSTISCPPLRETSKSSTSSFAPLALMVRRLKKVGSKSLSFLDFIGINFGLSGLEFTISKGPGVALT